ncbi:MAG: T9SS type A sorting domain-containing protein [candidate division Zixibacteria bacterium]|nr:T9SS type A sorting domain-containing protein [candidate division Zixibacteria bacterium]
MIDAVNKTRLLVLAVLVFFLFGVNVGYAQEPEDRDTVWIWYGTPGDTAIQAQINDTLYVDIYVETAPAAYVADILIVLGVNDSFIDTLLSGAVDTMTNDTLGAILYPFSEWVYKYFASPAGSPPNPDGWSSQSFLGFANFAPPYDAPWLHVGLPVHVLTMAVKTANNPDLVGQTVEALGPGQDPQQGPSNAGDTSGGAGYEVVEYHSLVHFIQEIGYVSGTVTDAGSGAVEGAIVTATGTEDTDTTDIDGGYAIELGTGSQSFTFSHPAFYDTTIFNVLVDLNDTTYLNVSMTSLPGGYIAGTVVDSIGNPIEGVIVSDLDNTDISTTDNQGAYILQLPFDTYDISFSHANYFDTTVTDITIVTDETIILDMVMIEGSDYPDDMPENIEVHQNYPNPFNQGTFIEFELDRPAHVVVEVFDILGRKVETVASFQGREGMNTVKWNSDGKSSGIYFCRVRSASESESRAMLLVK